MPRNEPRRLNIVFFEKLQQATDADGAGEDPYQRMSIPHVEFLRLEFSPREISLVESSPP